MDGDNTGGSQQRLEMEIMYMKVDGHWSNTLSDSLSFTAANSHNRKARIYTIKLGMPVISIYPSMGEEQHPCLLLEYYNIPMHEHYDACTISQHHISDVEQSDLQEGGAMEGGNILAKASDMRTPEKSRYHVNQLYSERHQEIPHHVKGKEIPISG